MFIKGKAPFLGPTAPLGFCSPRTTGKPLAQWMSAGSVSPSPPHPRGGGPELGSWVDAGGGWALQGMGSPLPGQGGRGLWGEKRRTGWKCPSGGSEP